jgi:hypothetical protein
MSTKCSNLSSDALIFYVITGEKFLKEITATLNSTKAQNKFVTVARNVAQSINQLCSQGQHTNQDRRVILIRGLPPALITAKMSSWYRNELPVLCEMVASVLMLDHDYVVLQALRKKENETHMILQQMALACYHHQYLTHEI